MRLFRPEIFATFIAMAGLMAGCSTPEVGAPCLPEQVPPDGFQEAESYIETSSVQCETRVCMVYQLKGDPRENCIDTGCDPTTDPTCVVCADTAEVDKRIYCTCRCKAPNAAFAECECPAGYSCTPVLEEGGPGVQGSYCVNTRTVTTQ